MKAITSGSRLAMLNRLVGLLALAGLGISQFIAATGVEAAPVSDVRMTKHNLSKYQKNTTANPNTTKSTIEDQVCVFCHTPHQASASVAPLWNRSVSNSGYTRYTSLSLDANYTTDGYSSQPGGSSLLCLSCHDGQVALGTVNVNNGRTGEAAKISVSGSTATTMPTGSGSNTGFTRHIGTDLRNDHPISVTYDDALADRDGELAAMSTDAPAQRDTGTSGTLIGIRSAGTGYKPKLPLQATGADGLGQVQCGTCHDPHLYDSTDTNRRFLRLRRLDQASVASAFRTTRFPTNRHRLLSRPFAVRLAALKPCSTTIPVALSFELSCLLRRMMDSIQANELFRNPREEIGCRSLGCCRV